MADAYLRRHALDKEKSGRYGSAYTGSNEYSGLHCISLVEQHTILSANSGHDACNIMVDCNECIIN